MVTRCTVPQGTASEQKLVVNTVPFEWAVNQVLTHSYCAITFSGKDHGRYIVFWCTQHAEAHVRRLA